MKKLFKMTLSLLTVIGVLASFLSLNVSAAGTIIAFSSNAVTVGEDVTVSITVNPEEAMYGVKFIVNYDSNVLEYKSGSGTGGAGTLQVVESPSGATKVTYSLVFTSKAAGTSTISVVDCVYGALGASGAVDKVLSGASANVTVKDVTLSSNANLKSLRPLAGTMTPAFSPDITEYTVAVKNSVTECKISAVTADSGAKFDVEGSANLKIGENVRTVIVTAPNGTQKSYKLTIIRSADEEEPVVSDSGESTGPLETEISGTKYTVLDDISSVTLFKGFSAVEGVFGETNVQVAADINNNYRIYYLKTEDSETPEPYIYNEASNTFKKVEYLVQGEYAYIFAEVPADYTVSKDYYETNATVAGMNLKCYASADSNYADFYYVYCFADGQFGFYRYDSKEGVIQRAPELSLIKSDAAGKDNGEGFFARFATLTTNAKVIVISLAVLIVGAIALAVILIIRFVRKDKEYDPYDDEYEYMDEPFDEVSVEDTTEQEIVAANEEDDF